MIEVYFAEVDQTTEYVDRLNIPWYGNGLSFKEPTAVTGRVTSFMFFDHKMANADHIDRFMAVWWDEKTAPTIAQLEKLVDDEFEGFYEG